MTLDDIQFISTNWQQHNQEIKQIRTTVFIEEQHVPADLEWDEFDTQSIHFLAFHNNKAIATARLKPDGQIGRMAVVKDYRYKGIGKKLLTTVISRAENTGFSMIYLHAQKKAINFYKQFNFINNGEEFTDAGIKHQAMYKIIT